MWLFYIPRRSLPDWLNQSSFIMASILSSSPSLEVQNCELRLVFRHSEVEFKEVIRHCIASLAGSSSEDADPERLRGSVDHRLKDKGKRPISFDEVKSSGSKLLENSIASLDTISQDIKECNSKCFSFSIPFQIPVEDQGCKSDSAIRLKADLQSLLLRCYEVCLSVSTP
jgi:hypothetical protein